MPDPESPAASAAPPADDASPATEAAEAMDPAAPPPAPLWLRAEAPIAAAAIVWAALITTPAAVNMIANHERAWLGIGVWVAITLVMVLPLGALIGTLGARLERAHSGLAHPDRRLWALVGASTLTAVHWLLHLAWAPLLLASAAGASRPGRALLGAVVALVAWAVVGGAVVVAVSTWRRLASRFWDGIGDAPLERRVASSTLAATAYAWIAAGPGLLIAAVAIEEGVVTAVALWMMAGAVTAGPVAALGTVAYARLPHAAGVSDRSPNAVMTRFWEIAGAMWAAHWLLPLLAALAPLWRDHHHDERLAFALVAAMLLTIGVAARGLGVARLEVGASATPAPAG